MIPILPLCTLGDPQPYIPGSYQDNNIRYRKQCESPKVPNKCRETTKPSLIEQK